MGDAFIRIAALAASTVAAFAIHAADVFAASARASAYDLPGNTLGCGGVLRSAAHVVASRTLPCGTRLRLCYGPRCTFAVVRDRGPWVAGRDFDLNRGVIAALGFATCQAWGVRTIRWRFA